MTWLPLCLICLITSATMRNFWRILTYKCVEYYNCLMILELRYRIKCYKGWSDDQDVCYLQTCGIAGWSMMQWHVWACLHEVAGQKVLRIMWFLGFLVCGGCCNCLDVDRSCRSINYSASQFVTILVMYGLWAFSLLPSLSVTWFWFLI